jgi:hypothetical protein
MDYGTQMGLATGLNEGLNNFLKTYTQMRQLKNDEQRMMQQQQFQQMQAEDMGLLRGAQRRRIEQEIEQDSPEARERALQIQIEKENRQFERDKELAKIKNQGALDLTELKNKGLISGISMRNQGAAERAQMGTGAAMQMNQDRLAAQKEIESLKAQNKEVPQGLLARAQAQPEGPILIPGFERDPKVVVDKKGVEAVRKAAIDSENMKDGINDLKQSIQGSTAAGRFNPLSAEYADIGAKMRELQLVKKELANLGVLNGPDLMIVNEALGGDPRMSFKNPKIFVDQLDKAQAAIDRGLKKKAQFYGFSKQGEQPAGLVSGRGAAPSAPQMSEEDMAALQWAQSNPRDPRAAQILKQLGQ